LSIEFQFYRLRDAEKKRLTGRRDNKNRERSRDITDTAQPVKPLTSWARTLTGPVADTAAYFFDYPQQQQQTSNNLGQRARPSSPEEYYNKQQYHHTPGQDEPQDDDVVVDDAIGHNGLCPALTLENGQIFCSAGYREGSRCTYSCQRGYRLAYVGRSVKCTCNEATGCMWNRPPQQCHPE